ncbi:hypothetical protein C8R43DRAFT_1141915 [Mycena crocata]|nr:hypothetical protein C8R43DRAFT_1141915 [Mycena crocata]
MATVGEDQLLKYAERVEGKVVVLTGEFEDYPCCGASANEDLGGGNGIGRQTAVLFAQYGAKIVIGDINGDAASKVVEDIQTRLTSSISNAAHIQCNVLRWDDQVALFESAVSHFGSVDVVIPCAGLTERGMACAGILAYKDGKPLPPNMSTLEVNLFGVLHTVHLGLNYLRSTRTGSDQWKALILMGSMASWEAIPITPMYTCSKFAVRGLMRSLYPLVKHDGIRIGCVDPIWADTPLLSTTARLVLTGTELVPVSRIAKTVLYATTDPDATTSGCSWLLPDNGPVLRLEKETIQAGTYPLINRRIENIKIFTRDATLTTRRIRANLGKVIAVVGLAGTALVALKFNGLV